MGIIVQTLPLFRDSLGNSPQVGQSKADNFGGGPGTLCWFLPEASFGLQVLSLPMSVCLHVILCVNHLFVRTMTQDLFKLGSPNLDHIVFLVIDLDCQGQI